MHTQITFENFSAFANNYAKEISTDMPLKIDSPAEHFLPPVKLIEMQRHAERARQEEQILVEVCDFLQYERTKI